MQNLTKAICLSGLLMTSINSLVNQTIASAAPIVEVKPFYEDELGAIKTPSHEVLEANGYKYQGGKYLDKFTEIEGKETLAHYFIKNDTDFIGLFTLRSKTPYGFLFVKGQQKGTYYDLDGDGICEITQLQEKKDQDTQLSPPVPKRVLSSPVKNVKFQQKKAFPFNGKLILSTRPNSNEITKPAMEELEILADWLISHPDAQIRVEGYIASLSNSEENIQLSAKRAETVKKLLLEYGVAHHQIEVKGMGNQNPIGDNSTWEGRSKNRRVEITLLH